MRPYILSLLLLCSLFGNTQTRRFRAGLIGGLVGTDVAGFDLYDFDNDFKKAGPTFGGYVNAKLNDKNSFQFEISYIQKGSKQNETDSLGNLIYFYLLRLDYIEVPLLFRHQIHIQIHSKSTDRFAVEVGPSVGALVHVYQEGLFYSNGAYYSSYFDNKDFRRTELALNAGVSYNFAGNFFFDVRYSNSIFPITKNKIEFNQFFRYTFNKGDNMVFSFTLRYLFNAGKKEE